MFLTGGRYGDGDRAELFPTGIAAYCEPDFFRNQMTTVRFDRGIWCQFLLGLSEQFISVVVNFRSWHYRVSSGFESHIWMWSLYLRTGPSTNLI